MTWRYTRNVIETGEVVAFEDINENFEAIASEVEGRLNEHNFAGDSFALTDFEDDAVLRAHRTFIASDGNDIAADSLDFDIPALNQWSPVGDLVETFTARGGLLWVMASFQLMTLGNGAGNSYAGIAAGLRINGYVDPDSVIPAEDLQVEETVPAVSFNEAAVGMTHVLYPVVCETIYPVPPGPCTVEVVVRLVADKLPQNETYRVYHRELITLEMLR